MISACDVRVVGAAPPSGQSPDYQLTWRSPARKKVIIIMIPHSALLFEKMLFYNYFYNNYY